MAPPVEVVIGRHKHRGQILDLLRLQFEEHSISVTEHRLAQSVTCVLADPALGFFVVAEDHEAQELLGFAYVSHIFAMEHGGRSCWLDELFVRPEHRCSGIGTKLLDKVMDQAWKMGAAAIDLEVFQSHNRAESLYLRKGFYPIPDRRNRFVHKFPR